MKRVTAFVGSIGMKNTYKAFAQLLNNLQALGEVQVQIVRLNDYKLGICPGCRLCFNRGEEFCPLKDDRDALFDKLKTSDGVVFVTPNYYRSFDFRYCAEKGWLESGYFYPTHPGLLKKSAGYLFDRMTPTIRKMFA